MKGLYCRKEIDGRLGKLSQSNRWRVLGLGWDVRKLLIVCVHIARDLTNENYRTLLYKYRDIERYYYHKYRIYVYPKYSDKKGMFAMSGCVQVTDINNNEIYIQYDPLTKRIEIEVDDGPWYLAKEDSRITL